MLKKRLKITAYLALAALLLHIFSWNKDRVEQYFSRGIYPQISTVFRYITGFFSFSVGDVLYLLAIIFVIWRIVFFFIRIKKSIPGGRKTYLKFILVRNLNWLLAIYIIFNLLWGLNYNRRGVGNELGLELKTYTKADLVEINEVLLNKVNDSRKRLEATGVLRSRDSIFQITKVAYANAAQVFPFLNVKHIVIKNSLFNWLGNSGGFTGYYNPFSGEAQVDTDYPAFTLPYVTCHEVAHQAGYAKEMEANFVGYLTAVQAHHPAFDYSVYFDLFLYANRNLYYTDSVSALGFRQKLDTLVKQDAGELRKFMLSHRNVAEPVVRWFYSIYLRGNEQPEGLLSYDRVTGFIIAYYRKFGKI